MSTRKLISSRIKGKQKWQIIALIALLALTNSGFNYINWNPTYSGWIQKIVFLSFIVLYFLGGIRQQECNFQKEVLVLTFVPFLSIINSTIYYSQSLYGSITALAGCFAWLLYFLLHKYKVSEAVVLRTFLIIALFMVAVQIIQQFTYPKAFFGVASEADLAEGVLETAEQRNGLWRFRIGHNAYYTAPILFAAWVWYRKKNNNMLPLICLLFVSVYLTLTRQVMAACIITIFFSFLMDRKVKMSTMVTLAVLVLALYYSYDLLFSTLVEQTKEDSTDDNVRILSATYFWGESIKTPFTFLFGYGLPANGSAFANHMENLKTVWHFFTSDVGLVGQIYETGFIYVLTAYIMWYRMFFKWKYKIPKYVRLFVLFTGVMSIMIFPIMGINSVIIWTMLLYVCDLHINHSPLALTTTQNENNRF